MSLARFSLGWLDWVIAVWGMLMLAWLAVQLVRHVRKRQAYRKVISAVADLSGRVGRVYSLPPVPFTCLRCAFRFRAGSPAHFSFGLGPLCEMCMLKMWRQDAETSDSKPAV